MKSRRILAIVTAVAMLLLPTQALADDQTTTGDSIITGDAIVNYVDPTTMIRITVPTSEALQFTLDPQNLAATQGVGQWDPSAGGSIIPAAVGIIANKSAIPIKTTVDFSLTDDAGKVVLLDNSGDVNTGTDNNMFLSFVPAKSKTSIALPEIEEVTAPVFVKDGSTPKVFTPAELTAAGVLPANLFALADIEEAGFGQFVAVDAEATGYNQVIVPISEAVDATEATTVSEYASLEVPAATAVMKDLEAGASLAYVMNKAMYYVVRGAEGFSLVYDGATNNDNYDTASFIISGIINKNANWSGYNSTTKIKLTATYSFEKLTDAAYSTEIGTKIAASYNSVETVAPVLPSISSLSAAIEAGTAEAITVSLGTGSQAATDVTVTCEDDGDFSEDDYDFSGTTLTFTADYIDSLIEDEVASREYTVTFNNAAHTAVVITLTYTAPVPPSITETTSAISADTAVPVTVSLGAGAGAAEDITSVTYNDGGLQTLVKGTDYTFSGTTLTFTSAYINSLISGSVTSREYTITFDDTSATTDTYTLTYTASVAPSISATTSAISADTAVPVTVSLGAGAAAADDITSVTYNDGSLQTLVKGTDYTFSGTTLTFTSAYINSLISGSVTSREYTVTFNNTAATTDTYTLTYTAPVINAAPSIGTTSYTVSAAAVPITINFGTGSLAATGVEKVTYLNSSSQLRDVVLGTSYTISGNTLTLTSSFIQGIASGTTRVVTITFNDSAHTAIEVTLQK